MTGSFCTRQTELYWQTGLVRLPLSVDGSIAAGWVRFCQDSTAEVDGIAPREVHIHGCSDESTGVVQASAPSVSGRL